MPKVATEAQKTCIFIILSFILTQILWLLINIQLALAMYVIYPT